MFYLIIGMPLAFIFYAFLKIFINSKSYNDNMDDESMAKELGSRIPNLSDKILNILQLSKTDFKNPLKKELVNYAVEEINSDINNYSLKSTISRISIKQWTSFILINIMAIISIISMNSALTRIIQFDKKTPNPFKIITIGNLQDRVIAGEDFVVEFKIEGEKPDNITLYWTQNNRKDSTKILMNESGKIDYTFKDIRGKTKYWAVSRSNFFFSNWDTVQSKLNTIKVLQRPDISNIEFEINPPEYSNLSPYKLNAIEPQIRVLMNSKIDYKIKSNQKLQSAIIINDKVDSMILKKNNSYWNTSLIINKNHNQEILLKNSEGIQNQQKFIYKIKVLEDYNPELYVISPNDKMFEINNTSQIPLQFKISDDYGLDKSWIEFTIIRPEYMDIDSTINSISINSYIDTKSYSEAYKWELSKYNLFPGDEIKFQIVVKDNNPESSGITKSQFYNATYPSFEDIFNALESNEKEIDDLSKETIIQIEELDNVLEEIKLDLLKATDISPENQQKVEESVEKMNDIFSEIKNMEEAINNLKEQAEKDNIFDQDLTDKFEQFQNLLNDMMSPELLNAMQKMNDALENMDLKKMLEAVENFDYNLDQFEKQLDRFIEMFELAIAEQKIEELTTTLELMIEQENEIETKLKNDTSTKQLSSMQKRQNEKFQNLQNIMEDAKESTENFSEKTSDAINDLMNSKLNQATKESLKAAQKSLSTSDQNAMNHISESKQNLTEMYIEAKNIQELFKQDTTNEMIQLFYSVIDNILKLSQNQESLILISKDTRMSSPKMKEHTFDQFIINKQFTNFIDQLMNLSTKTFYITPDINNKIGFCKKAIDNSIINLEQRKFSTAKQEQSNVLGSMNEIAILLLSAMNEMKETGSASGLSSYLEKLEKISQGQSELNMNTMQLGQMGMMQQSEMMKRLEGQQKALQEKLQEILDDMPGQNQGGLSKASEDMLDIVKDLKNNRITNETIDKQNQILSRLLDSQKSLKEKDYSSKREGAIGLDLDYSGPLDIPNNLGQNNILFMDAMEDALNEGYSEEYKKMFRKYYRNLLKNENDVK